MMTNHIIGLSGGKDSTALALRLRELNPKIPYTYICTPTGDEAPEMLQHWRNLETLLDSRITHITRKHTDGTTMTLDSLIEMFNALPNWRQRWCTRMLKIEPTIAYIKAHQPAIMYVGLRADEEEREGIYSSDVVSVFPMQEWGWGLKDVRAYLDKRGVQIPVRTDCLKCYEQRRLEWKRLLIHYPDVYAEAEAHEARTGRTFRSPSGSGVWPVALKDLRVVFENGTRLHELQKVKGIWSNNPEYNEVESCRVCRL